MGKSGRASGKEAQGETARRGSVTPPERVVADGDRSALPAHTTDRNGVAAYRIVAHELRTAILQHRYPEGSRLPTEAELAEKHQLSRQTVRRAFQELVSEGMVYRVPGRGTFPTPRDGRYLRQFGSIDDLMGLSEDTELEVLTPLRRQVNIQAASRLRLPGDAVYTVTYRRIHGGEPLCHTTIHIDPAVGSQLENVPELTEVGATSKVTVLAMIDGLLTTPIIEAEQSVTAAGATTGLAEALGCQPGDPLLLMDRMYLTNDHKYVELAISYFLPEHYSYRVKLRRNVS
jgi:GntR family transcriptional regulator